jgi:hypothetical protein
VRDQGEKSLGSGISGSSVCVVPSRQLGLEKAATGFREGGDRVQGACIHKLQYDRYDMVSTWSSIFPMNKTSN